MENLKRLLLLLLAAAPALLADPGPIRLRGAVLDPAAPGLRSQEGPVCRPSPSGRRNYIVQPERNFSRAELEALEEAGMLVAGHVPPNAYVIFAQEADMAALRAQPDILYVCECRPEYKLDPRLKDAAGSAGLDPELWIALSSWGEYPGTKNELEALGCREVRLLESGMGLVQARVPREAFEKVAALGAVLALEPAPRPEACNYYSHRQENLDSAGLNSMGYTGKGEMVVIADSGLDSGNLGDLHPDLPTGDDLSILVGKAAQAYGRSPGDWTDYTGHGTHVAGIAVGLGTMTYTPPGGSYPQRQPGVAPGASLGFAVLGDPAGQGAVYPVQPDDLDHFYALGARVANCSWGNGTNGFYAQSSRNYDGYMWNRPEMLMVFAAGNNNARIDTADNCTLTDQGSAKNVLTVGASQGWNPNCHYTYANCPEPYLGDNLCWPCDSVNQGMAKFSSHGPCADGRMKPDLVAPGSWITSLMAMGSENGLERAAYYCQKHGTSMAAPAASGCALLVREYLKKNGLAAHPSAALVKAVLINGCRSLGSGQYGSKTDPATGRPYEEIPPTTPNCVSGYGHIDLVESLLPTYEPLTVLEGSLEESGQEAVFRFACRYPGAVSVTLCWTDYPGSLIAAQALVNDLDLTVSDGSATYYAGGAAAKSDSENNVEQFASPFFGPGEDIRICVKAANIMSGPQPFALAISGLEPVPEPATGTLALLGAVLAALAGRRRA